MTSVLLWRRRIAKLIELKAYIEDLRRKISRREDRAFVEGEALSAVLILIDHHRSSEPVILLTKRTESVESHKGQVSFPGGYCEARDIGTLETALREAEEEVGLSSEVVEVVGRLEIVHTHQKVPIVPWVGIALAPVSLRLNPSEVTRALYLPLRRLFEEGLSSVSVSLPVGRVFSTGIKVDEELVWGATARILAQLRELLLIRT